MDGGDGTEGVTGHVPVMLREVLEALSPGPGARWLDATLGLGGHAGALLRASGQGARLLGLDRDPASLRRAGERLKPFGGAVELRHGNFSDMDSLAAGFLEAGSAGFDGVLMDLGVSSPQLDEAQRGFSFQKDGPLDMRMDPGGGLSAAQWLESADEEELVRTLRELGEEREARRVARAIRRALPLRTTLELAGVVSRALGGRRGSRIHPATRTFQALRMAVNRELESVREALPKALALLKPGGRLAVISFHSLEDRAVKEFLARESRDCLCPPEIPFCRCGHKASLVPAGRKPRTAAPEELEANPRARSAKLRAARKI